MWSKWVCLLRMVSILIYFHKSKFHLFYFLRKKIEGKSFLDSNFSSVSKVINIKMIWWIVTLDSSNYIFHNWSNISMHIKHYSQLGRFFLTVYGNFLVCGIKMCTKFNKCVIVFKLGKYQASCFLCKLLCPKHSVYYQNEKWQHFVICSNWYCTL